MVITFKPNASPDGQIKVEAGGITFFFNKDTPHHEIMVEVKRTIKAEMGLIDNDEL